VPSQIEIAVVGRDVRDLLPLESFYGAFFDEDESTRPWSARRRASLSVESNEPMGRILERAAAALDLFDERDWSKLEEWRPPDGETFFGTGRFIALRNDASPIPLVERLTQSVTLVDETGRARWGAWLYEATYAEIRAAAEAGALAGDPTMVYLNVRPTPAGGGELIEWELLLQIWRVAWDIAVKLAAANELHDLYRKIRDRLDGSAVVASKTEDWLRRNGYAYHIEHMLGGEPWSARDLAGLCGCTVDEAGRILALYGYEEQEPGEWFYAAGIEQLGLELRELSARVVKAYTEEALFRYASQAAVPVDELAVLFTEIVRQAVEEGRVAELPNEAYHKE
jgi:hypothetical protein